MWYENQSLKMKLNYILFLGKDIATYKVKPCGELNCEDPEKCIYFHNALDKRRNRFEKYYK